MNLIVIEGLDGAGKSTQIKLCQEYFDSNGFEYEYLHFPRTDAPFFGELISRFLRGEFGELKDVDPSLVAMLYAGDRKDVADDIAKWLADGKYVLCDRYVYSNVAYQCAKVNDKGEREKLMDWIFKLEFEYFSIPRPAVNIFLDVPSTFTASKLSNKRSGKDRAYLNGNTDIHESSLLFQKNVRSVFIDMALTDDRLQTINCSSTKNSMLAPEEIFTMIKEVLNKKGIIK